MVHAPNTSIPVSYDTPNRRVTYSLLELPAELQHLLHSDSSSSLLIKGQPNDDAVLCTATHTYSLRAVKNSNSLLLSTPAENDKHGKEIKVQMTLDQTLEVARCLPKIQQIDSLLKGWEWDLDCIETERKKKRKRGVGYDELHDLVQASEEETRSALYDKRIVEIDGNMRPLAPSVLPIVIPQILNQLIVLDATPENFNDDELVDAMQDELPAAVIENIVLWFSKEQGSTRCFDMTALTREVGVGLLSKQKKEKLALDTFIDNWREAMGDQQSQHCDIDLLKGFALVDQIGSKVTIQYLPISRLPLDPTSRFSELFSIREKWRAQDMLPFIQDLAVDNKKREAMILKFVRKIKGDGGEVVYASRSRGV